MIDVVRQELRRERLRLKKSPWNHPEQITFGDVEEREFHERVRWKGGLTRTKNVKGEFDESCRERENL